MIAIYICTFEYRDDFGFPQAIPELVTRCRGTIRTNLNCRIYEAIFNEEKDAVMFRLISGIRILSYL